MPGLRLRILLPALLCGMALLGSGFTMAFRFRQEYGHVRERLLVEAVLIFGFWYLLAVMLAILLDRLASRKVERVAETVDDPTGRQPAQQSLEESERRYRGLFEAMKEGMALHEVITDGEGRPVDYRYLDVNPAFEAMTGIPRADWIGRTVREVLPQIEEKWIETYGRVALTGESVSIEDYVAPLDRWYQTIAYSPGPRQFAVLAANITDRKRAEQALKESEERFRTLAEGGSDLVYRYRFAVPAGFDYLSPSTLAVTGYTPDELYAEGTLGMRIIHPDDRPVIEAFTRTLEEPKGPVRLRWIRKDGQIIWIEQVFRYLRDAAGSIFGVQGVARDVTTLVEAEEALRTSEANQRALLNSMPDFLFVLSREGRFLDYHTQQIEQLMLPPEAFLGHLVTEVLPDPLAQATMAAMEAAFRTDKPQPMAYSIPFPTGVRHYDAKVTKVTGNTAMLLSRDITEQEVAKSSLAASEARFRALIEEAPVPLFVHQDGRFVYCNPASVRLLGGSSPSDLLGKSIMDVIHPDFHEVVRERIRKAEEDGKRGERIAEKFIALDGHTVDVEAIGIRITMSGRPAILVFAEDVTERNLTETLRQRLENDIRQAQKLESLGSLAGGVAHDMNNVLGAILGMATLQGDQAPPGSSLQRSMETITKACQRGATLVKGLLGFARQGLAEEKVLDLNTLVHEEVALLERTTLQKVRLVTDLAADLRPVLGDAGALSHALMNLCVNAVDAMKDGGTLTLTTRNEGLALVLLEVADTGSGMPPEVLEKALDPFFTTKPQGQGTGLGLPMVYGTVKAHRGHMTLQSEPGRGTKVSIRLPATRLGDAKGHDAAARVIARTPSLAILVVDDDELFQASMAAILTQLGHRPTVVSSGEAALNHLTREKAVDLVILDLNMPGMGGAGTLPRLRELRPELPVVLATGRADQHAVDLIGRWKRVTLLAKPFSIGEVEAHLESLL